MKKNHITKTGKSFKEKLQMKSKPLSSVTNFYYSSPSNSLVRLAHRNKSMVQLENYACSIISLAIRAKLNWSAWLVMW